MADYRITTEQGIGKIATLAKQEVLDIIIKALTAEYGEEWVRMARVGTSSSMKNVLAVRVGELVDEDGFPHDLCTTVEITTKSHKAKTVKGKTTDPFDFVEATEEYEDYLTEKATKQAEAKAKKAKGSKTKQEKDEEKAKKTAELNEARAKVEAKQKAEAEAKRYRVEVNGETVAENLTMDEAKAKRDELANSGEVKIFEQR
jgi:hypothetical protein